VKTAQSLNKAYAPSLILIGPWRGRDWVILVRHGALPPTRRAPMPRHTQPVLPVEGTATSGQRRGIRSPKRLTAAWRCRVSARVPTLCAECVRHKREWIQSRGRSILTSVRLQSPSAQPGGSSPAISNALFVEPGFVAKTANTWPEQLGAVVKLAIV
jgi:hypothetical protein